MWTDKMAQGAKALAAKPSDPSSIPETHIVEGENELLQAVL
jgi:hypothetical protein